MIPPRIDITFPRGSRVPTLRKSIDVHVFARETFDLRREVLAVGDKLSVGIYSAERTLIDIIWLFEGKRSNYHVLQSGARQLSGDRLNVVGAVPERALPSADCAVVVAYRAMPEDRIVLV
jgi:hypothetical protein